MLPNACFIVGGGPSLRSEYHERLKGLCSSALVVGTNLSYKFFDSDVHCVLDDDFYRQRQAELHQLPLIATRDRSAIRAIASPNSLFLPTSQNIYFGDESLKKGVYTNLMCGAFALTLAIWLYRKAHQPADIYLLGFDFGGLTAGKTITTHFYQADLAMHHRGIGKVNFYNITKPREFWKPFLSPGPGINIYNVSLESKIPVFDKISYESMFVNYRYTTSRQKPDVISTIRQMISDELKVV